MIFSQVARARVAEGDFLLQTSFQLTFQRDATCSVGEETQLMELSEPQHSCADSSCVCKKEGKCNWLVV